MGDYPKAFPNEEAFHAAVDRAGPMPVDFMARMVFLLNTVPGAVIELLWAYHHELAELHRHVLEQDSALAVLGLVDATETPDLTMTTQSGVSEDTANLTAEEG